jgi:hypothetical protein
MNLPLQTSICGEAATKGRFEGIQGIAAAVIIIAFCCVPAFSIV